MTQHTIKSEGAILTHGSVDAVFKTLDGTPVLMDFHRYLGPSFSLGDTDQWDYIPEADSEEWDNLWKQFEGWMEAKGEYFV